MHVQVICLLCGCCIYAADLYRIVHVALNEYIHHVVELLQMKVVEAQFNGCLVSSTGKTITRG